MARNRRGGNQPPASPAAVSGPGALSRRTDGGAGSQTQPIRVPSGQPYGERQAAEAQQAAAPLPVQGGPLPSAFRPTERPNEPITAGIPMGPGDMGPNQQLDPSDPDIVLQVLYSILPHPEIARLMMTGNEPGDQRRAQ